MKSLRILGTRGIPARHGGFETFAEHLALYLAERGWEVSVYCQTEGNGPITESWWRGVRLFHCPVARDGALSTMIFDWNSTRHAAAAGEPVLTLGYNTASFCLWYRLRSVQNLINMDGLEWQRAKWSRAARVWLWINERLGARFGDHLIADHPEIQQYLERQVIPEKITMIPYGARCVQTGSPAVLEKYGLENDRYAIVIARPEPENSILQIVSAFSRRPRGCKLVLLGNYDNRADPFLGQVRAAASEEVLFPGAIYDAEVVDTLRFHARLYVHGHTVGGTNPSLVEALGAGNAVLANDNEFNRWVAGPGAAYFRGDEECAKRLDQLMDPDTDLGAMRTASRARFAEAFEWGKILQAYETMLERRLHPNG